MDKETSKKYGKCDHKLYQVNPKDEFIAPTSIGYKGW